MYSFIVLGIIPGTDYQITFFNWLMAALAVGGLYVGMLAVRRQVILKLRLVLAFYAMTRRQLTVLA